jgi:hypothetical protein
MAIDFKQKLTILKAKDVEPLTEDELNYIKTIEDYIDSVIEAKLSTDNLEIWIDATYIRFNYNPKTKKPFLETMTNDRKKFLKEELLSRYKKANWEIKYYNDDGLDGPNMSGGDYLILKGKLN